MLMQYRQITLRLRVQRGAGNPDYVSERPRNADLKFTDSEDAPTLCSFDEYCQVDIPFLLQVGAIVEYVPPIKEADDGKSVKP